MWMLMPVMKSYGVQIGMTYTALNLVSAFLVAFGLHQLVKAVMLRVKSDA